MDDFNDAMNVNEADKSFNRIDMNSFSPSIVHCSNDRALIRLPDGWMDSCLSPGSILVATPPTSRRFRKCTRFLSHDDQAKKLAFQYGADIIMSSNTMECLLQRPGSCTTQWSIPILYEDMMAPNNDSWPSVAAGRKHNIIIIMEDPVPQKMTPRQSLTFGINEVIYETVASHRSSSPNSLEETILVSKEEPQSYQMVYTLLTLPAMGTTTRSFKILVRSCNLIIDESGRPINFHGQLEYFLERGLEETSSYERCIYMMEKMLQPNCRVIRSRLDVQELKVVKTEDMTAHAIMNQNSKSFFSKILLPVENETDAHFHSFVYLLHGIMKNSCRPGSRYLLCIPSKDESVAFPQTTSTLHNILESDVSGELRSIEDDIEDSVAVSLGRKSLQSCFKHWIKDGDRNRTLPFTFKPRDK
jgi:hypothetical protein